MSRGLENILLAMERNKVKLISVCLSCNYLFNIYICLLIALLYTK